ncbi:hypothetical protein [Clostridium sp. Marseille-P2415]|uniref:hypothetical protein n=1 Tax=Clostridium sp. Marseille-P2415 TaxID=1805471 RepID=UPI0009888502|nr:hypothetical protein [Clostridium sp. Marseille-P2415]
MKYLEYPLFAEGFVNRFLITEVYTQIQQFTRSTLSGRVNEWLKKGFAIHENPCRKEFVSKRREEIPLCMDLGGMKNGDSVTVFGQTKPVKLYFPFGNTGVDASGFYYQPTYLRQYGYVELWAQEEGRVDFELETCGGLTLWVNDQLITDFTPFTRNLVKKTVVSVPLMQGQNKVIVCLDDLAERDTDYYFRMKRLGHTALRQLLPAGDEVDETVLKKMEQMLHGMSFDKEAYISEPVKMNLNNPFEVPLGLDVTVTPGEFIEKMQEAWKMVTTKHYCMEPGQKGLELFETDEMPPGYYYFTASLSYMGIHVKRKIGNQLVQKEFLACREEELKARKRRALETVIRLAPENTYKAAALFQAEREYQRAERIILSELEGVRSRKDCSDFHFIIMIYIYRTYRDRISDQLKEALEEAMLNYRYWIDEPGDDVMWFFSENHALLFHCCQYLAGSYLPDRVFTNSGKTGTQVKERGEELLHQWFDEFFREFITEWNSNAYIPVDVLGIGTLYNLTDKGSLLHEKAGKALDMIFYSLAVNAHKGAVMTSFGRTYEKEMKGNYNAGTTSLLYVAYNAGYLNRACIGYISLILGDYEAPEEYRDYAMLKKNQEMIFQNTQGFEGHVNLYLYKNSHALLSTAVGFKPFQKGYQEHIMQAAIDEMAQAFINHPGESFPYGSGRPNFWAGNGVLPLGVQYRDTGILRYHMEEGERIDYTHAYIPISAFSRYKGENGVLVLEKDGAYLAVKALNGLTMQEEGPNRFREFISMGRDNVWVVRVGSLEEYGTLDGVFEAFKKIEITLNGEAAAVVDDRGDKYLVDKEFLLRVNGKAVYDYPLGVKGKILLREKK